MNNTTIGIDIAKDKFDVAIIIANKTQTLQFDNNQEGFNKLIAALPIATFCWFIMEATGNYGKNLAEFLYHHGHKVSVLNPVQIKYYAKSKLSRAKTDKIDAKIIAQFAVAHPDLPIWQPLEPNIDKLRNLSRCLLSFKEDAARVKTRLQASGVEEIKELYKKQLAEINVHIDTLQGMLIALINNDAQLKANYLIIQSVPGIGITTAITLLAELPDLRNFKHAKQLTAFIGVNPSTKVSGSSVRRRSSISKIGSSILRKALFLPAMVCCRFNSILKIFAQRLKTKGKNGKLIIIAVMRKLIHILFAMLKKSTFFDEKFLSLNA